MCALILASTSHALGVDDPHKAGDGTTQLTGMNSKSVEAQPSALASAITSAKNRGWPLLILRVPDVEANRYLLGRMWGTYFSLATHAMLEDLALCDIVCAPDAQIARDLPMVSNIKDWTSGIALFLDPGRTVPAVVQGPIVVPPWWKEGNELHEGIEKALEDLRIRLHGLIAPDRATIERRAREGRSTLSDAEFAALGEWGTWQTHSGRLEHARRIPAWLLLEQVQHETDRHFPLPELWGQAWQRLQTAPEGSRWDPPTPEFMRKSFTVWDPDEGCTMPGPAGRSTPSVRFLHLFGPNELDVGTDKVQPKSATRGEHERTFEARTPAAGGDESLGVSGNREEPDS